MRAALDRLSLLLVGWIPDLSRIPLRRQVAIGALASLLLHLVIVLGFVAITLVFPQREDRTAAPEQPLEPLTVEIAPARQEPEVVPAMVEHRAIIDPRGLQASPEKPKDARFESDRDMIAGSKQPATGILPLPSQEGATDRPTHDFADQDVQLRVREPGEAGSSASSPQLAPSKNDPAPAATQPPPLYRPMPVSPEALAAAKTSPNKALPEPAVAARSTPPPLEKVVKPRDDQMVVARLEEKNQPGPQVNLPPTPSPRVHLEPTPAPRLSSAAPNQNWLPMLSTPRPTGAPGARKFQEELKPTRVEGTITNHGDPGVAAVATPAGRWWMLTKSAIAENWSLFIEERRDLVTIGTVRIAFAIDGQGKLHDIRVESNTGNSTLVEVCLRALQKTEIPPPPADLVEPFRDQKMDNSITFTYF